MLISYSGEITCHNAVEGARKYIFKYGIPKYIYTETPKKVECKPSRRASQDEEGRVKAQDNANTRHRTKAKKLSLALRK